jgi:hypothetical protein
VNKALRQVMLAMVFLCGVGIAVSSQWWPLVVLKVVVGGALSALTGIFLSYLQDKTFPLVRDKPTADNSNEP